MAKWYEEGFFQTPKLLRGMVANSEYEKERDTTWTELFADLIFVTAIARIGKESEMQFIEHALYFFTFWTLWNGFMMYMTRFGIDDLHNKFYVAFSMIGLVNMTANVQGGIEGVYFPSFIVSMLWIKSLYMLSLIRIGYYLPETRNFITSTIVLRTLEQLTLLCSIVVLPGMNECLFSRKFALFLNIAFESFLRLLLVLAMQLKVEFTVSNFFIPLHLEHCTERMGGFIIIVLGESIDGISQFPFHSWSAMTTCIFLSFFIVFMLKLLHFDTDVKDLRHHALRQGGIGSWVWYWATGCLALGLSMTGDSLEQVIRTHYMEEGQDEVAQRRLCYAVALVIGSMTAIDLCHVPPHEIQRTNRGHLLRLFQCQMTVQVILGVGLCIVMAQYRWSSPLTLVSILLLLLMVFVVVKFLIPLSLRRHSITTSDPSSTETRLRAYSLSSYVSNDDETQVLLDGSENDKNYYDSNHPGAVDYHVWSNDREKKTKAIDLALGIPDSHQKLRHQLLELLRTMAVTSASPVDSHAHDYGTS